MELISREDAKRKITEELDSIDHVPNWVFRRLEKVINSLLTIEEQKKGSWIPVDSYSAFGGDEATWEVHGNPIVYHYCSECKEQAYADEFGEELLTNYCPNCGARMKGE